MNTKIMMDDILCTQPGTSSAGGDKKPEDVVTEMCKDFERRLPRAIETREGKVNEITYRKLEDGGRNSLGVFIEQEAHRFNALLNALKISLYQLQRAILGLVVISAELEEMYNCFLVQRVPPLWINKAYPSLKPLGSWFTDLVLRIEFVSS